MPTFAKIHKNNLLYYPNGLLLILRFKSFLSCVSMQSYIYVCFVASKFCIICVVVNPVL